jgi:PAS domain S-box-containing protein
LGIAIYQIFACEILLLTKMLQNITPLFFTKNKRKKIYLSLGVLLASSLLIYLIFSIIDLRVSSIQVPLSQGRIGHFSCKHLTPLIIGLPVFGIWLGWFIGDRVRKQSIRARNQQTSQLEHEIQERKRIEASLRQSEARFQKLAANLPGAIYQFRLNPDGSIAFPYISEGCRELYELEPEQIQNNAHTLIEPIHPDDLLSWQQSVAISSTTLQDWHWEGRIILNSGKLKWIQGRSRPQQYPTGEIIWDGYLCDISDRKQAEIQLQERKQFLHSVYEGSEHMIFVVEVLPNGAFRFVDWNPSMERARGYSSDEIVGKTPEKIFGVYEGKLMRQRYTQCVESGTSIQYEESLRVRGKETWWLTTLNPLRNAEGKIDRIVGTTLDITERQRAAVEQQKFITLVENSNDFISIAAMNGRTLYVNAAGCELVGIDAISESLTMQMSEFYPPAEQENFHERIFPTVMDEDRWEGELQMRHISTGEEIEVYTSLFVIHDRQTGQPLCIANVSHDLRERKRSEAQLREKEQFLRSVYEGCEHSIFVVDVLGDNDFRFKGWNPATERLMGITEEFAVGKTPEEVLGEVEGSSVRQRYVECIKAKTSLQYEECLTLHGLELWELTTINPIADEDGNIYRLVGTSFNITDRRLAEEALRSSELRFRNIIENANDLIYSIDMNGIFTYASPNCYEIFGYQPIELMGQCFGQFFHPDDANLCAELLSRLYAGESRISGTEYRVRHRNGSYRWHTSNLSVVREADDETFFCIGIARDITESKQAEAALRQQKYELEKTLQELQQTQAQLVHSEKMSSLGQMVAGVAHEINNPVNFIHGNLTHAEEYTADLLRLIQLYQQYYSDPPEEIQEELDELDLDFLQADLMKLLKSMRVGTDRIREIVKSLRTFSRLDEAEVKAADLHEGIFSTLMILQSRLKANGDYPEIEISPEFDELPLVECYVGQLNQVFMNLIANAIDALEDAKVPNPKIRIETAILEGDRVVIRIADNGAGMSEEIRTKLFDPFFTTKPVGKGTGLGLSISYQIIVEKHRGQLRCKSIPGQGSEFEIEIPIYQPEARI